MANNDYLVWAAGGAANVESQAAFAADAARTNGEQTGKANSARANKLWRQASMWSAAWGAVLNSFGQDANDDGTPANLAAAIQAALSNLVTGLGSVIPSTGDAKITFKATPDTGWILLNDGSIGNVASNATTRNNADTQALFTLLWNNTSATDCPIQDSSGTPVTKGASATADYTANRRLVLPASMGHALVVAGAGAGLTARVLGRAFGEENHVLTVSELAVHAHGVSDPTHGHGVSDPTHTHVQTGQNPGGYTGASGFVPAGSVNAGAAGTTGASATGISINAAATGISIANAGSGAGHNVCQPSVGINVMVKL